MEEEKEVARIIHLQSKYSSACYDLIKKCEAEELKFYLYLKLYAINHSSAFPSDETIKKDLDWSSDKRRLWVQKMVEKKRLKYTPGSGRISSAYDIRWYDYLNEYSRGRQKSTSGVELAQPQGLSRVNLRGGVGSTRTIRNITNTNITNKESTTNKLNFTNEQITELKTKFPSVNVLEEKEKAQDFLLSTGKKYKNYLAFFRNWLRRSSPQVRPPEIAEIKKDYTMASSNPLFREWTLAGSKGDFRKYVDQY